MEVVSINSLKIRYGAKEVFGGLDWKISRGENWAVSGESGTGKSCLLKAIAGKIEYSGAVRRP